MLGNLDSLPLGMGLRMQKAQVVPARYAGLQGVDTPSTKTVGLIALAVILFLMVR